MRRIVAFMLSCLLFSSIAVAEKKTVSFANLEWGCSVNEAISQLEAYGYDTSLSEIKYTGSESPEEVTKKHNFFSVYGDLPSFKEAIGEEKNLWKFDPGEFCVMALQNGEPDDATIYVDQDNFPGGLSLISEAPWNIAGYKPSSVAMNFIPVISGKTVTNTEETSSLQSIAVLFYDVPDEELMLLDLKEKLTLVYGEEPVEKKSIYGYTYGLIWQDEELNTVCLKISTDFSLDEDSDVNPYNHSVILQYFCHVDADNLQDQIDLCDLPITAPNDLTGL